MEIHNLMEELVSSMIEQIAAEDAAEAHPRYCTTPECRVDAICYVLNRMPPRYVSSSRGVAHLTEELKGDQQIAVDIVRLAHEGLHRVSAVRRSYYGAADGASHPTGPCFNLPTIKGRLLDGASFSPLSDIEIELVHDGEPVEMYDSRWTNPYRIPDQAPGTFLFWPAPVGGSSIGEKRDFWFEIRITDERFDPLSHSFVVSAESAATENRVFTLEHDFTLPDLYLFRK